MDPLSVTASIVAILQLSSKVIAYLNDVNDASKDRARCAIEATNLHSLLTMLRFRLEDGSSDAPWHTAVRALAVDKGPLDQFKQTLELLQKKMTEHGGTLTKASKALMWKFEKAEISGILSAMERLKTLVQIALEMDHFKLSQAIKQSADDTSKYMAEIKDDTSFVRSSIPAIDSKLDSLQHQGDLVKCKSLMAWLSSLDFPTQQADIIGRRQEGTGQWFLNAPEFVHWLSSPEGNILFCPGMPGAGKTMIAAIAIDHLCKTSNEDTGLAYVFCNYKAQGEQNVNSLLAAILKQLVQVQPSTVDHVSRLYSQHAKQETRPSTKELFDTLQTVVETFPTVYVIVDALDEFQNRNGTRRQLVDYLQTLQKRGHVRLMITSRPLPNIGEDFKDGTARTLEVRADDDDVKQFVAGQIYKLPRCIQRDAELQDIVQKKIVEAVNGMFLLALLHVDSLRDKRTKTKVQSTLEKMRKGSQALDEAYESALERINCQLPDDTALAKRGLSWIINAVRPLTTTEICHALAVEPDMDETDLDPDNILDVDELVSVCAGLVIVDEESAIVRLVHYTTQEYFERIRGELVPSAQLDISLTCLTYLSFDTFRRSAWKNHTDPNWIKEKGLLGYAAQHWGEHAQTVQSELCDSACVFLRDQALIDCAMTVIYTFDSRIPDPKKPVTTGLHVAARFGLHHLTAVLLSDGCEEVMKSLNILDLNGETPLSVAILHCYEKVSTILLDNGANIEGLTGSGLTPLQLAAKKGFKREVDLLLDRGADVNSRDIYVNALQMASINRQKQVIQLLLDRGADINATNYYIGSALAAAASKNYIDIVQLLLDEGADINVQSRSGYHALQQASFYGHEHMVTFLLDNGADIDVQGGDHETALQTASSMGHASVVKLLIDRGADANAQEGQYSTALQAASMRGDVLMVRLLVEGGADTNAQGGEYGYALLAAAWRAFNLGDKARHESELIVKILLDNGANVDMEHGTYRNALYAAVSSHQFGIISLLLEKNPNSNANDSFTESFLKATSLNGWTKILRLVHDQGRADLFALDSHGRNLLHLAARGGHLDTFQYLIELGLDPTVEDAKGDNLLSYASLGGSLSIVDMLLKSSASSWQSKQWTPLHWACRKGHTAIVERLVQDGFRSKLVHISPSPGKWCPMSIAINHGQRDRLDLLKQVLPDWKVRFGTDICSLIPELSETYNFILCDGCFCHIYGPHFYCSTCLEIPSTTRPGTDYCFMCKSFLDHVHEGHEIKCIEENEYEI